MKALGSPGPRSRRPLTTRLRSLALSITTVTAVVAATVIAGAAANAGPVTSAAGTGRSPTASADVSSGPLTAVAASRAPQTSLSAVSATADRATVTVDTVTPSIAKPGDVVTVTGTVTAPATGPLTAAEVRLVQGSQALMQRRQIDQWSAGTDAATGTSLGSVTVPTVAPTQSAPYIITLPSGTVRSDKPFAALPIAVEVVQAGALAPVGVTRTFFAWNARKEYEKLQVATVLPVTLEPDADLFSRQAAARDNAWTAAIGPGSRVRNIIDGTQGSAVSLAIDPSVFGTEVTRDPSRAGTPSPPAPSPPSPAPTSPSNPTSPVATSTPQTTGTPPPPTPDAAGPSTTSGPSPGSPAATTTPGAPATTPTPSPSTPSNPSNPSNPSKPLTSADPTIGALSGQLVTALAGRSLWALPYADADLAATADIDPTNPLVRDLIDRSALVAASVGRPVRANILWPVDGLLPARREADLAKLLSGTRLKKPAAIVVDQRAITTDSPYTPTARRVGTGRTRLLGYDSRLSSLLPQRGDAGGALPVQRYLAETLVLLGERAGTPRSVLVVAPRTFDPDAADLSAFISATASAPWITTVDPASLVADAGTDRALPQQRPKKPLRSAAPAPALTRPRLKRMETQRVTLSRVAGVLRDGDQFERTYREVLNELASVRWRYQRGTWPRLSAAVAADTRAATSAIKVVTQRVNFFAQNGTLQITVVNGLPFEVADIRLRLAPTNPRMQIDEQPGPITIAPDSKRVVKVPVTAVAAGQADIRAFLTTADGTPIGSEALIPVAANPIDSKVYGVGGALVALVLLFGVARALRRGTSRVDEIGNIDARRGPTVG